MRYILALILIACSVSFAQAQAPTRLCITTNGTNCIPNDITYPYPQRSGQYGIKQAPQYCQITSLSSALTLTTANCATGSILTGWTIAEICIVSSSTTIVGRYLSAPGLGSNPAAPTSSIGMPASGVNCFQYSGPNTISLIGSTITEANIETFP